MIARGQRWLIVAIATLAYGLSTPPATRAGEATGGYDPVAIYKQCGVTAEQEAQIRALGTKFEEDASSHASRIKSLVREIHRLSLAPDPDARTVLGKQDELNKLMAEMANNRIRLMLKIRTILTPDQKSKLVKILKGATG